MFVDNLESTSEALIIFFFFKTGERSSQRSLPLIAVIFKKSTVAFLRGIRPDVQLLIKGEATLDDMQSMIKVQHLWPLEVFFFFFLAVWK